MSLSHDETRRKLAEVDKQQQMAFDAVQEANLVLLDKIDKLDTALSAAVVELENEKLKEVKP